MLCTYAVRFDVTENLENFCELNKALETNGAKFGYVIKANLKLFAS